ncbi:MAG: 23S rRNA (uracil(1939)-C(5))-methyltransferase RlmD [Eubacteriales bacterium]|nr:23S rRNA (uracil(1939)-C(5))-methyltransferase RlmD [Eubacteriales bacterium]
MAYKKDDLVTLTIEDIGAGGEGIGKADGYTVFVKDTVIGDVVEAKIIKAKKNYGYARLIRVVKPSDVRVEAVCPVAKQCGGCQLQHMSYEAQLRFKEKLVKNNVERIGGLREGSYVLEPIIGMDSPFRYRNKAQYPVGYNRENELVCGFYAGRTHYIVDCGDCVLGAEENAEILEIIKAWMKEENIYAYNEETTSGIIRHILIRTACHTDEIMVCLIVNANEGDYRYASWQELPAKGELNRTVMGKLVDKLSLISGMSSIMINYNTKKTNVILGDTCDTLWGRAYIEDYIGNIKYQISPLSFFQVNPQQTEKLYNKVLEYASVKGGETVWDLYCGIGTISLFLAGMAKKVYGVEIVPQAIEDARNNAKLNGINNAEFFVGKAEEVVPAFYDKMKAAAAAGDMEASRSINPDVIVVDPPRKGCEESLLETIIAMSPERIVYVSCDSATLARDLKYLEANGYKTERVQPVDQFGHTVHVETVVLLSHKKPDSHINIKVEFGEGEGKVPLKAISERAEAYKPKERVTYKMIKEYIEAKYGFKVHTAYIAEVKRDLGLPMYDAPNAVEELKWQRKHPTAEKVEAIKDALTHFGAI